MAHWRDKLCGSVVYGENGEEQTPSIQRILSSNEILSCGGGFYPSPAANPANLNTLKTLTRTNLILPTKKYSVLVFKEDGNAVIYSEEEDVVQANSPDEGSAKDFGKS